MEKLMQNGKHPHMLENESGNFVAECASVAVAKEILEMVNSYDDLVEALRDARSFMDSCQMNESDDPCDRSDDQSPLDALKERTDRVLEKSKAGEKS